MVRLCIVGGVSHMIVLIPLMPMRRRHIDVERAYLQACLSLYYLW
jgi:hypothetical protein